MIADQADHSPEVMRLYLRLMRALDGASLPAVRSALAMAVLISGENSGLSGEELLDWIEQTGNEAKAVLAHSCLPRH
jgi:hypothetical protein